MKLIYFETSKIHSNSNKCLWSISKRFYLQLLEQKFTVTALKTPYSIQLFELVSI